MTRPFPPADPARAWDTWLNAEIYREYVETFSVYRELNRRLADLAELRHAQRVLDLGCGTGATAVACLEELSPFAELDCVDAAPTMLATARSTIEDPRARFHCARAERVDEVVRRGFDRAICNAAFGLFARPSAVIRAIAQLLDSGGLFVFNVPLAQLDDSRLDPAPFQISLAHALAQHTGRFPRRPHALRTDRIGDSLRIHGFDVEELAPFRYRARQGELMELMQVPALAIQLAPDLDYDTCLDVVRRAADTNDPQVEIEIDWVFFVARRRGRTASPRR